MRRTLLLVLLVFLGCTKSDAATAKSPGERAYALGFEYASAIDAQNFVRLEELADKTVVEYLRYRATKDGREFKELIDDDGRYVMRTIRHPLATFGDARGMGYLTWCTATHRYPDHPEVWPVSDGICVLYIGEARVLDRITGQERDSRGWSPNPERSSSTWRVAPLFGDAERVNRIVRPLASVPHEQYARVEQLLKTIDPQLLVQAYFDENQSAREALEAAVKTKFATKP